jgi:hypothetical protein
MDEVLNSAPKMPDSQENGLSDEDIADWMKVFGIEDDRNSD